MSYLPLRRAMVFVAAAAVVGVAAPAVLAPASAAPKADYQMPFPCGQVWSGSSRSNHSPSSRAIDWNRAGDVGDPVVAAAAGTVTTAVTRVTSGYGKYVVIDHGRNESTLYAHLNGVAVKVGAKLKQGRRIGRVGSTGNSTGPHLHFEQRSGRTVIDSYFDGKLFRMGSTLKSANCAPKPPPDDGGQTPPPPTASGDVPLAANWFRDAGKSQLTLFRPERPVRFIIERPNPKKKPAEIRFGIPGDVPVLGDWDGEGTANAGVFRPSTRTFYMRSPGTGLQTVKFGQAPHQPLSGDWNGDGVTDLGIRIKSNSAFRLRHRDGSTDLVRLGDPNDIAVTGDWDGDGVTDVGVYDKATSTFTLRKVDQEGRAWTTKVAFGKAGDLPVIGDWDGNGRDDLGVWTPATGKFSKRVADSATDRAVRRVETRSVTQP